MNVSTEDIRNIKPGETIPFLCEDGKAMFVASSLVTRVKRVGMPEGVVDYEVKKFFDKNIVLIRAMRAGDEKVLNG